MSDNPAKNPNDTNLTIRDHQDPDKHWIGETLPAPTQGELAGTVGSVSGPGDSPFPARADHMHKLGTGVVTPDNIGPGLFQFPGFVRGAAVTLLDDQAAYLNFSPVGVQYGMMLMNSNASSGHNGVYAFRTGDASAYLTAVAQSAGSYTTTLGLGSLAGTTGVDGQTTIRAWNTTAFARIYLENRTAATRAYAVTFINLATSIVIPALTWTII